MREQLVNVNVAFAQEIISMQSVINEGINDIASKVMRVFTEEKQFTTYYKFLLKPPITLLLQLLEATISSVGNINQMFVGSTIEFDPFYLLKKYLPSIDWDEFQRSADDYNVKLRAKQSTPTTPTTPESTGGTGAGGF